MRMLRPTLLVLTLALTGCARCGASEGSTDAAPASSRPAGGLTQEDAKRVLARVGDRVITLGDFAAVLERLGPYERMRYQAPERRKELLEDMITVELLAAEAIAKGYDQDPLTQLEIQNALRDALLADLRNGADKPEQIPQDQVRAWYNEHAEMFKDPERRRVSAIVLSSRAAAEAVLADLQKDNTALHFGQLVQQKSVLPDAKIDLPADLAGDLGIASPPGDPRGENPRVPEPARVALFAMAKVGDLSSTPVEVGGAFYVLRLTQILDARARTFEEAERSIRVRLAQIALDKREDDLALDLRKSIPVKIDEAALAGVRMPPPSGGALLPPDGGAPHAHDHGSDAP